MTLSTVLFVETSPTVGGAARVLLTILSALDPRRARGAVVCSPGTRVEDAVRAAGHATVPVHLPTLTFEGGARRAPALAAGFARATVQLAGAIRRDRPALIHANGIAAVLLVGVPARLARVPVVWHVHDMLPVTARNRPFVRAAGALATSIACVSTAAQARVLEFGVAPEKCFVVRNCVPPPLLSPAKRPSTEDSPGPTVLAVGALTPLKGQHVLLDAARILSRSVPALRVAFAGEVTWERDRGYADRLRATVEREGLRDVVEFLGFRSDVDALMARATVVAHPSTQEETFGLVPLEAMAAGRPVVASRIGGIPEVVTEEAGILVEPGRGDELAAALARLLADPALRDRMGAAGMRIARERFSPAAMIRALDDVYAPLAGHGLLRDGTAAGEER